MRQLIHLDQLEAKAQIGIHDFERAAPQAYRVSIWLGLDNPYWCALDDIKETVNYDQLRTQVLALLASTHFNLQETVVQRVLAICFELDCRVCDARVTVTKPSVYPDCKGVGLDYACTREEWRALPALLK